MRIKRKGSDVPLAEKYFGNTISIYMYFITNISFNEYVFLFDILAELGPFHHTFPFIATL